MRDSTNPVVNLVAGLAIHMGIAATVGCGIALVAACPALLILLAVGLAWYAGRTAYGR